MLDITIINVVRRIALPLFVLLILLTACNSSMNETPELDDQDQKVSAEKMVIWWDEEYGPPHQRFAGDALKARFEGTQFEFHSFIPPTLSASGSTENLVNMLRSESSPDLIVFDSRFLTLLVDADYLAPIPDMYGLEMDSNLVSDIRITAPDLTLYALPYGRVVEGLFYNKAIFDALQVPYPKDGMTWDEVITLARHFKNSAWEPLGIQNLAQVTSQQPFVEVDPEIEHIHIKEESWEQMIDFLLRQNELYRPSNNNVSTFGVGNSAMVAGTLFGSEGLFRMESNMRLFDVEWDVVSYPVSNETELLPAEQMIYVGVPARSKNRDDAYKVLSYLLSRDVQADNSRKGLVSLRGDATSFTEEFGTDSLIAGKSISSFFYTNKQRASYDISFEDSLLYNHPLRAIIHNTDSQFTDFVIKNLTTQIRREMLEYFEQRSLLIEDLKSKQ